MRHHTIKVFAKTQDVTLLQFVSPEGKLIGERELNLSDIERFAAEVERKYRVLSPDSTTLKRLGQELYEWLDGLAHRWLSGAMKDCSEMMLRINVDQRLRHLPWELLHAGGAYLCSNAHRLFTPALMVTEQRRDIEMHNRPLRLLFMACSAENVRPLLDFEREERLILQATRRHQIELFVEESGSLDCLGYKVTAFGPGHFDVFHLTGHADVRGNQPCFLMEDNRGGRQDVSAEEIAEAFQGNWPRLIFFSGCRTGEAPDQGHLPSFCEAMVAAGAPAVLGWALPVGDEAASMAAAELYEHLAIGKSIDEAVSRTRLHLMKEKSRYWHLLRLYVNATPLDGLVTPLKTPGRARLLVRDAAIEFIDARTKVEVCKREFFVGHRRTIQRCLRTLQSRQVDADYAEGVLLHGMVGLGKSSLAVRLCERMSDYKLIVFSGALGNADLDFVGKITEALDNGNAIEVLNRPGLSLMQRLRNLFRGPLATEPRLFVFDDFEQNLEIGGNGYIVKPVPLEILKSLMTAIREINSESRVIVTSRYQFPLPPPLSLLNEGLESLRGGELEKKLSHLENLQPYSPIEGEARERAIQLGAGNPRLLEWLNRVLAYVATDATAIMEVMESKAEEFRESALLRELLDQLPPECRRMLSLASVYELPFDRQALAVAVGGALDPHLARAVSLGLIEGGINPATGQSRYFVSRVMLPLIEPETTSEEKIEAARRATEYLYQELWKTGPGVCFDEALGIFRLAMVAREREIAAEVGSSIATRWVDLSRYHEAESLCRKALALGEDPRLGMCQ